MKSYRKELWFETPARRAFINITDQVEKCLNESGIQEGLILINAMHITSSVFINDDESGLHHDFEVWLEKLAPRNHTPSINTMASKIMPMPISNAQSWVVKPLWLSQTEEWISDHGNRSFMANSTAKEERGFLSK